MKAGGNGPDKLFWFNRRVLSDVRFAYEDGIVPEMSLCATSRTCNVSTFPRLPGREPEKPLLFTYICCRLGAVHESGRAPERLLLAKLKYVP